MRWSFSLSATQPGDYACSTVEIDQMVDIASAVPGVRGARIAGAGLAEF